MLPELTLREVLEKPIAFAEMIQKQNMRPAEISRALSETELFDPYKGPFHAGIHANYTFNDTIKVTSFKEDKQPEGSYLITYNLSHYPGCNLGVYVRVLTSRMKRFLKYRHFPHGHRLKLKGQLDMLVTGPMVFGSHSENPTAVSLAVAITVIDL